MPGKTKTRILRVANRRLRKDGVGSLSMRAIAGDLGITPMALYRHFPNKGQLLDELSEEALNQWAARLEAIGPKPSLDWLLESLERFLVFALDEPESFEAAFLLAVPKARRYPTDIMQRGSTAVKLMLERIERAQAEGTLTRKDPPEFIGMTFWALAQGLVGLFRAGRFTDVATFRSFYRKATARCVASFRP